MQEPENFNSFIKENGELLKEYIDNTLRLYKLKFIRVFSILAGQLIWMFICLMMVCLALLFVAGVAGFWLSGLFGSYTLGFGLVAALFILVVIVVVVGLKKWIMNGIVGIIIRRIVEATATR